MSLWEEIKLYVDRLTFQYQYKMRSSIFLELSSTARIKGCPLPLYGYRPLNARKKFEVHARGGLAPEPHQLTSAHLPPT